jgi:hypothetical protein
MRTATPGSLHAPPLVAPWTRNVYVPAGECPRKVCQEMSYQAARPADGMRHVGKNSLQWRRGILLAISNHSAVVRRAAARVRAAACGDVTYSWPA